MIHGQEKNALPKIFALIIFFLLKSLQTLILHGNKQVLFIPVMILNRQYIFSSFSRNTRFIYKQKTFVTNTVSVVVVEPCLKNSGLAALTVSPMMCNMAICSQSFSLNL